MTFNDELASYIFKNNKALINYANKSTHNYQDAEDVVQETMITLIKHQPIVDSIKDYIYKSIRRSLYSKEYNTYYIKKYSSYAAPNKICLEDVSYMDAISYHSPDIDVLRKEHTAQVLDFVSTLKRKQQQAALQWMYEEEYPLTNVQLKSNIYNVIKKGRHYFTEGKIAYGK